MRNEKWQCKWELKDENWEEAMRNKRKHSNIIQDTRNNLLIKWEMRSVIQDTSK